MRFFVTVKSRAKEDRVDKIDATHFKILVKAPPVDGKANEAVLRNLAAYLNVPYSQLNLVSGHTAKQKVIELL